VPQPAGDFRGSVLEARLDFELHRRTVAAYPRRFSHFLRFQWFAERKISPPLDFRHRTRRVAGHTSAGPTTERAAVGFHRKLIFAYRSLRFPDRRRRSRTIALILLTRKKNPHSSINAKYYQQSISCRRFEGQPAAALVVSQFEFEGLDSRSRYSTSLCSAESRAPIWNSPPVSSQVIGRTRFRVRLADAPVRDTIQLARLVEWAQTTTGGQRPTGLDPLRSFVLGTTVTLCDGGLCHQLFGLLPGVGPASRYDLAMNLERSSTYAFERSLQSAEAPSRIWGSAPLVPCDEMSG
jgi:hypothetical protein